MEEDPRVTQDICGVTTIIGLTEFICIRKTHAKIYQRRNGGIAYESNPRVDNHYFVNRWPNRHRVADDTET